MTQRKPLSLLTPRVGVQSVTVAIQSQYKFPNTIKGAFFTNKME